MWNVYKLLPILIFKKLPNLQKLSFLLKLSFHIFRSLWELSLVVYYNCCTVITLGSLSKYCFATVNFRLLSSGYWCFVGMQFCVCFWCRWILNVMFYSKAEWLILSYSEEGHKAAESFFLFFFFWRKVVKLWYLSDSCGVGWRESLGSFFIEIYHGDLRDWLMAGQNNRFAGFCYFLFFVFVLILVYLLVFLYIAYISKQNSYIETTVIVLRVLLHSCCPFLPQLKIGSLNTDLSVSSVSRQIVFFFFFFLWNGGWLFSVLGIVMNSPFLSLNFLIWLGLLWHNHSEVDELILYLLQ